MLQLGSLGKNYSKLLLVLREPSGSGYTSRSRLYPKTPINFSCYLIFAGNPEDSAPFLRITPVKRLIK